MAERSVDVAQLIDDGKLGRLQITIVIWLSALMVLEGFDMQAMAFAAPAIIKEWGAGRAAFGPVLSASLLGYMVGALALGAVGDVLGRKMIIVAGAVIFGLFSLVTVFAASLPALMVLRFGAGIGLGASVPAGVALASEYVPLKMRSTAVGIIYVGYTLGAGLGGFLVAWTIPAYGWHSVFYIGGVLPLLVGGGLVLVLPESVRFLVLRKNDPRRVAAILRRLRPDRIFAEGTQFVVHEETRQHSSVVSLFSDNRAVMTLLLWFAFIFGFVGHHFLTGWLPTVISDAGFSVSQAVIAAGLYQIGGTIGSYAIGLAMDRWGKGVVALTYALAVPFVVALGVTSSITLIYCAVFIAGIFIPGGGNVGLIATAGMLYPTTMRSTGTGWAMGVGRIGSIMGPVIGGILLTAGLSQMLLFMLAAIPLLSASTAIFALTLNRRRSSLSPAKLAST
jgi:AAHS family 4-hydroxybenzoate transporter-like MFS transporter